MNFFHELQLITRAYCEINGLPVPQTLLCSDSELEWLKREIERVNEATRILKKSNDEVRIPRTTDEYRQDEKKYGSW